MRGNTALLLKMCGDNVKSNEKKNNIFKHASSISLVLCIPK